MMPTKNDAAPDVQQLREELGQLRQDFKELTSTLLELGKDKARSARDRVTDTAEAGAERLKDLLHRLRERGGDAGERLKGELETHPAVSLLAAFGLGFVIGKVLDRR